MIYIIPRLFITIVDISNNNNHNNHNCKKQISAIQYHKNMILYDILKLNYQK